MFNVKTNNNSKEYYSNLNIENDAIYITANTSLSKMMQENCKVTKNNKWRIIDIDNFLKVVYPKWENFLNRIKMKNKIRKILLSLFDNVNDLDIKKEVKYFNDNIDFLVNIIILIIESGVNYINYNGDNIRIKLIKYIFNNFIDTEFYKNISSELLQVESFNNLDVKLLKFFNKNISELTENINNMKINKVYFYNINYIDLKRYMIIKMLDLSGYNLLFRIPYYKDLNKINECWTMLYKNQNIFNFEIDKNYMEPYKRKIKFIDYIEGRQFDYEDNSNILIKKYREVYDFKEDMMANNAFGNIIITFDKDSIKSCIPKDNKLKLKHCYQSSFGRFLKKLYSCEVKDNNVIIDFSTYREMITSGWIEYKSFNGVKLSSYLMDNSDYFLGVKTINDIINRIEKIKDIKSISNIFDENAKLRVRKNETKAFLSNPFKAFGYVNTKKYEITINYMLELTKKLKNVILKTYVLKDNLIDIKTHFKTLLEIFCNEYIKFIYKNGSDIDKKIIRRIYICLKNPNYFGQVVYVKELEEMFNVFLSFDSYNNKNNLKNDNSFSIDQLEGIIYRDKLFKNKIKRKICLSDFSYSAFEKYIRKYELNERLLSKNDLYHIILNNLNGKSRDIVKEALRVEEISRKAYEKYIIFALANLLINFSGEIEISYIDAIRKDDGPAILLRQMESIYKNSIDYYAKLDINYNDKLFYINTNIKNYDRKKIKLNGKLLPEVAYRDLDFCFDKFLFSSIINDYPVYYSDFHNQILFSILSSLIKGGVSKGDVNVIKFLFPLFPQWKDVTKKNILDSEYEKKLNKYKFFDGINYPQKTDELYLLKSKYIVTEKYKIKNRYNKENFDGTKYYYEFVDKYLDNDSSNSGLHCKMCPYCYVCKKGDFVIDHQF